MRIENVRCFSENEHQFFFKSADFDVVSFFWEIAKHFANYGFGFTDFYKEELLN